MFSGIGKIKTFILILCKKLIIIFIKVENIKPISLIKINAKF